MSAGILLPRGMVIDVNLDPTLGAEKGKIRPCVVVTNDIYNARVPVIQVTPITAWSDKKARITTNVEIAPSSANGLTKPAIADCLHTRPIDYRVRLVGIRGRLTSQEMVKIDEALRVLFGL